MSDDMEEVTEFDWVDPLELHLVTTPATKYSPLLAKAHETLAEAAKAYVDAKDRKQIRKETRMKKKLKQLKRQLAKAQGAPAVVGGRPGRLRGASVFKELEDRHAAAKAAFEKTPSAANQAAVEHTGFQLTAAKMVANENARQSGPRIPSRFGPNVTDLGIVNSRALKDDPGIRYQ